MESVSASTKYRRLKRKILGAYAGAYDSPRVKNKHLTTVTQLSGESSTSVDEVIVDQNIPSANTAEWSLHNSNNSLSAGGDDEQHGTLNADTSDDNPCSDVIEVDENESGTEVESTYGPVSSSEELSDADEKYINSDSDSFLCDYEVNYLEEDDDEDPDDPPYSEDEENDGGGDGDHIVLEEGNVRAEEENGNGDPEDPNESDSNSDSSSSSEDESDDEPLFHFDKPALNRAVRCNRYRTVREGLLMFLALSCANNWTYKSLIDTLKAENILLGVALFPTCSKGLWRVLSHKHQGMTKYAYCKGCGRYLGHYENLNDGEGVRCRTCGLTLPKSKLKWFMSVSIRKQLMHLVSIPEMRNHLQYRNNRVKLNPDAYEDIFDGSAFKDLQGENGILSSILNISYVFETDGLRLGKSPKAEAWALLLRIVDLPPKLRQKHMLLAGIWIDSNPVTPTMNTFLKPFVKQANRLSEEGFVWKPDGVNEVTSKFVPLCLSVDYKARFPILQMVQYNSHFGCFLCDHCGVYAGGSMRYPSLPHPQVPPPQMRTDENVTAEMQAAHLEGEPIRGFRGVSILLLLENYRIAAGNVIDNLHAIFERVCPAHTELLLRSGTMAIAEKVRRINNRFLKAKPPSKISRTPYDFNKRGSYKAQEWRNWVFHYSVPCLEGLRIPRPQLDHWHKFCYATFLLSQDSITVEEVNIAEGLLHQYVELYEEHYGLEHVTPCVHLMTHLAAIVRLWGPLPHFSMFFFESYNQKILSKVTSPNGAMYQIVTRHLMRQQVVCSMYHQEGISEDIRQFIVKLMSKDKHSNAIEIDGVYLIGDGDQRPPYNHELENLQREGYDCDTLREFDCVIIDSCEYHSIRLNRDRLHDNTAISTKQNTFCIVTSIVVISHQDRVDFCGMFVTELDVVPLPEARHIGRIRPQGNLPHFIHISQVRCPAIKHEVLGETYVSSLPNGIEID